MKSIEESTPKMNTALAPALNPKHPVVARLMELQGTMSNQRFADRWLSCTVSSWGRIVDGKYHAKDASRMLKKLEENLASLEKNAAKDAATAASDIMGVALIRLGMAAVDRAFREPRNRLVVVLAPTGGGKTTFARALAVKHQGLLRVEASETWRSSYLGPIHAILKELGVDDAALPRGTRAAEALLLKMLKASPKTIVIDESHYFGPATINLVKAILNQTASTVVMLSIPELWARMKKTAWEESEQIRSRTCALVMVKELSADDVAMVFSRRLEGALRAGNVDKQDARAMVSSIRAEANRFGLMDTVTQIIDEIEADYDPEEGLTPEGVLKACSVVAALRG